MPLTGTPSAVAVDRVAPQPTRSRGRRLYRDGMQRIGLLAAMLLVLPSLVACGGAKIGEACDKPGSTDPCESGAVCGKDTSGATVCLKTCTQQSDCAATQECNGIEGSSAKGCRTKK